MIPLALRGIFFNLAHIISELTSMNALGGASLAVRQCDWALTGMNADIGKKFGWRNRNIQFMVLSHWPSPTPKTNPLHSLREQKLVSVNISTQFRISYFFFSVEVGLGRDVGQCEHTNTVCLTSGGCWGDFLVANRSSFESDLSPNGLLSVEDSATVAPFTSICW